MKKIEGIKEVRYNKYVNGAIMEGAISIISSDTIKSIVETVNELVEAHNQEVSHPDRIRQKQADKQLKEIERIYGKDEDFKGRIEVENNTEECKHKYILESHCMGLLKIRCPLCGDIRDIEDSTPIQELLSERSFSKEELKKILIWQSWYVSECGTYDEGNLIREKVDRLLSLEK